MGRERVILAKTASYKKKMQLQYACTSAFFEEAFHPDIKELEDRDALFAEWEKNIELSPDGDDFVMIIPELDDEVIDLLNIYSKKL